MLIFIILSKITKFEEYHISYCKDKDKTRLRRRAYSDQHFYRLKLLHATIATSESYEICVPFWDIVGVLHRYQSDKDRWKSNPYENVAFHIHINILHLHNTNLTARLVYHMADDTDSEKYMR